MWIEYNPNPRTTKNGTPRRVGDCVIRAIACATGMLWEDAYCAIAAQGFKDGDMPSSDSVWGAYLHSIGFRRFQIPDTCPDCYTVSDFAAEHPGGTYVIGTGKHAVAVVNGNYYDAWDSGTEIPAFVWAKQEV